MARRRFLDFTRGCLYELMSGYGPIDVLFYDCAWPMTDAHGWESAAMNAMVRRLQPGIIINDRSLLPEDYGTPEGHVTAAKAGRAWEACMTLNGDWGYVEHPPGDWQSVRDILGMLNKAAAGGGNLLLNIGPRPDGSLPEEIVERLTAVGEWTAANGEAMYGRMDRVAGRLEPWVSHGFWTLKGRNAYLWNLRGYPRDRMRIGGMCGRCLRASILATGRRLPFKQDGREVVVRVPARNPDRVTGTPVFKFEFASPPRQKLGMYGRGLATRTLL